MHYLVIALAIFSMFFGAGNVVFPLLLGTLSGDHNVYATVGLLLTSIGGPLLGLFGAILFEGKFKAFYLRSGPSLGWAFIVVTSALLGPCAVMPRCMVVAYAAIEPFFPSLPLSVFSLLTGIVVLFLTLRRTSIMDILGYVLSPLLVSCLGVVIFRGIFYSGTVTPVAMSPGQALVSGLLTGYDTMDLIAATYFAVSIWNLLKVKVHVSHVVKTTLIAGTIAGTLLGVIYVGLSYVASRHMSELAGCSPDKLLVTLSYILLGPTFGSIANVAVALACLTTIIGLAATFADIIRRDFISPKLSHGATLFILIAITALFSNLGFTRIMHFIHPVVAICYPPIIMLTLCNVAYKRFGISLVKTPVWIVLIFTLIASLIK